MKDKRGFVLMEVLCSIFILGFCAAVILFSLSTSMNQSAVSMQQFKAMELAQGKMDELVGMDYSLVETVGKTSFPTGGGDFQYAIDVENDAEHGDILKKITVTVYYTEPVGGLEKTVTLVGARAKK